MEILLLVSCVMYLTGLLVFSMKRKHMLLMLLSLEFVVLSLFSFIYLYLLFFNSGNFLVVVFLTFSVCEGVLGLSIMISLIRTHGNDYFQSFNLLW